MTRSALVVSLAAVLVWAAPALPAAEPDRAGWDAGYAGLDATLVVHDRASGTWWRHAPQRARQRFPPCSTFKVPHSLIGLELGILEGPQTRFRFDPERWPREPHHSDARWRTVARDHDLRSAIRDSVVWYYRELAGRIGEARMREWLERLDYGNRDVSAGIDRFWLSASLAISAEEQVAFLERLYDGKLGSPRGTAIVKTIMLQDEGDGWRLAAKTGLGRTPEGRPMGWWVGWVERAGEPAFFAAHVEADDWGTVLANREPRVRQALAALGLLPPAPSEAIGP